jgi:hypothetical protein
MKEQKSVKVLKNEKNGQPISSLAESKSNHKFSLKNPSKANIHNENKNKINNSSHSKTVVNRDQPANNKLTVNFNVNNDHHHSTFTSITINPNQIAKNNLLIPSESAKNINHTHNANDGKTDQIRVLCRFRPLNQVEEEFSKKDAGQLCVKFHSNDSVSIVNHLNIKNDFTLDRIFDNHTSQEVMFNEVIKDTISDILNGYNGTIFTYGQSGSGKTYTMFGADLYGDQKGIIPRSM